MPQPPSPGNPSRAPRTKQGRSDTQQADTERDEQEAAPPAPSPHGGKEASSRESASHPQDDVAGEQSDQAHQDSPGAAGQEPTSGGGAVGPPTEQPPPFSGDEDARRELHAFLGELHGLLRTLERNLPRWCPADLQADMQLAIAETHPAFGSANAELDTDSAARAVLPERGLAKDSLAMKLGRFRRKLASFYEAVVGTARDLFRPVQDVVRWALVPLDTFAKEIPGGTAIKEIFMAINEAVAEKAAGGGQAGTTVA
jgi:hypothetical protein